MDNTAIHEALEAENVFMKTDIECWKYEQREKAIRDYYSGINSARDEGRSEGLVSGIRQVRMEEKIETAKNMFKMGADISFIAKATNLSEEKISELKAGLEN